MHYDNQCDTDVQNMKSIIALYGFSQVVNDSTHVKNHILDWVLVESGNVLSDLVVLNKCISDHFVIKFYLTSPKSISDI